MKTLNKNYSTLINLIQKSGIEENILNNIVNFLMTHEKDIYISKKRLKDNLNIGDNYIDKLLRKLINVGIFSEPKIFCPKCNFSQLNYEKYGMIRCSNCNHESTKDDFEYYILTYSNIDDIENFKKINKQQFEDDKAKTLSEIWKSKSIYYFILDINNSEILQNRDEEDYNIGRENFLKNFIKPTILNLSGFNLILGDIGDLVKIVSDKYETLLHLFFECYNYLKNKEILTFKVYLSELSSPGKDTFKLIRKNLLDMWDINSFDLTKKFRIFSEIKFDEFSEYSNKSICLLTMDNDFYKKFFLLRFFLTF